MAFAVIRSTTDQNQVYFLNCSLTIQHNLENSGDGACLRARGLNRLLLHLI